VVALTPGEFEKEKDKFRELAGRLRAYPYIKSVYACLNKGVADVTLAGDIIQLYGDGRIKERVGGVDYYIYPSSFFQTNSSCCRRLYEAVLDAAAGTSGKALDIYCGSGGITLQLAGVFDEVTGVDNSEENIKYAAENAGLNGLENVRFVRREAEKFLSDGRADGSLKDYSVAVVDPPRSGLGRKAKEAIAADGAPRLVYVSCNPKTLADDLKELSASYKMVKLTPVDMFPHTHHLEAVASLERIRR
jgi:23S rRNA (uracil1939-C5)-methyltransferase